MSGYGTGYPNTFVCHKQRRDQGWDPERGKTSARMGYFYRGDHKVQRTGRTKPLASSQQGHGHPRALKYQVEYTCSCGHVGWTRLRDILYKPLEES